MDRRTLLSGVLASPVIAIPVRTLSAPERRLQEEDCFIHYVTGRVALAYELFAAGYISCLGMANFLGNEGIVK